MFGFLLKGEIMIKNLSCLLLAIFVLAGCASVTIHPTESNKLSSEPTFQETQKFFFWGLSGESHINVVEICGENGVRQMQSQMTFQNGFLTAITLGIYAPHSVRIWCQN